jgi:superfamily II DNA or RNA helicase
LKEEGYIASPDIYILPVGGVVRTRSQRTFYSQAQRGKEYNRVYKEGITQNETRNSLATQVIFALSKVHNKKTLVIVQHIEHGLDILQRIQDLGVRAVFVIGNNKVYYDPTGDPQKDEVSDFRSETVTRFIAGEFDALIASPVFGVGYNLPGEAVDAGVILSGGRGHGAVLQRLGRSLRPRGGDNRVIIVDFFDSQHFYLSAQSKKRVQEYETEGHAVLGWKEFSSRFLVGV